MMLDRWKLEKIISLRGTYPVFFEEMETGEGTMVVVLLLQPLIWD